MKITRKLALDLMKHFNINKDVVPVSVFMYGLKEEMEHKDITKGDPIITAKIVIAHLEEHPLYYTYLKKMIKKLDKKEKYNIYN